MTELYMEQLERLNARMQQFRDDPERRAADSRWKNNFLKSVQAIKEGREFVSVASGGSRSTVNRMKTMGLTSKICAIAQQIENTYCTTNEDTMLCKMIDTLQGLLGCDTAPPPSGLPDGSVCNDDLECQSGACINGFCSSI